MMKKCSKCGEVKDINDFPADKRKKGWAFHLL